jgi:S-adenosylmethionine:tRNA ribosyltransferase-isomerase
LKKLEIIGVDFAEITLHVGLGNFRSVDVEDLTKHKVDSERIRITEEAAEIVNKAKDNRYKVCAVGTTVVRTLESSVSTNGYLKPFDGWTNKFIFPPYDFKVPDMLISNFHLPYSTLLMMVAAFTGYELTFEAYRTAVKEKYRFGTYGDAMLVI